MPLAAHRHLFGGWAADHDVDVVIGADHANAGFRGQIAGEAHIAHHQHQGVGLAGGLRGLTTDSIGAGAEQEAVVAGVAEQLVVAGATIEDVVAGPALQGVVAARATDGLVDRAA